MEIDLKSAKGGILSKSKNDPELDAALSEAEGARIELRKQEQADSHARGMAQLNQGRFGSLLGSGSEKSGNIAFVVIIICFLLIVAAGLRLDMTKDFDNFMKFCSAIFAIITGSLGYLFGSKKD